MHSFVSWIVSASSHIPDLFYSYYVAMTRKKNHAAYIQINILSLLNLNYFSFADLMFF